VDDPDLRELRRFRIDETEPPPHLQAKIEEQLWQAILAEESAGAARRAPSRRGWLDGLLRPALAAGAALSIAIVVAVASDGGTGAGAAAGSAVVQAGSGGVLDSTARTLFAPDQAAAAMPTVGSIDLRSPDGDDRVARGPMHDENGSLDADSAEAAASLTRDPSSLQQVLVESIEDSSRSVDAAAFDAAMRWVVDPAVPTDLRAAMLRSLDGLDGIDEALVGVDVFGREGIVLGQLDATSGLRTQVVLDPSDATLLERRVYTTTYVDPACPPGTFSEHEVWQDGARIDPSQAQWLAWPIVIAACGDVSD
jgi:hypothetical protein